MVGGGGARKRRREDSHRLSKVLIEHVTPRRQLSSVIVAGQPILVSNSSVSWNNNTGADGLQRARDRLEWNSSTDHASFASSSAASAHTTTTTTTIQVAHGCLLLPVMMAAWWYWTKRKARKVLRRLHLMAPPSADNKDEDEGEDGFGISLAYYEQYDNNNGSSSSWEGTNDPYHQDPFHSWDDVRHGSSRHGALRWVQWFKGRGGKTTRTRRKVHANTLQNLRQGPSFFEQQQQQTQDEDYNRTDAAENGSSTPAESMLALGRRRAASVVGRATKRNRKQSSSTSAIHAGVLDVNHDEEPAWHCIHDTMGVDFCSVPHLPSSSSASSNGVMVMDINEQNHHQQQQASPFAATAAVVDGVMADATTTATNTADNAGTLS